MRPRTGQGRRPQQQEDSARILLIAITALMATVIILFIAGQCNAAEGYLITAKKTTEKSKTEVYKICTATEADSILATYCEGFKVGNKIMGYTETPTHLLYFEKKTVVTRRNGKLKFKNYKPAGK